MKSGTGKRDSFFWMLISVSTSRRLYALNCSHFSISCCGRFLVLPPLVLVGAQGTQKYLMRFFPSVSFCFSSPRTAPTPSKDKGNPSVADHTIVQCQLSG